MTSPQPSQRPVAPLPGWTVTHRGRGRRPDKIRSAVADRRPSVCTICFYRIRTTTQGERRHLNRRSSPQRGTDQWPGLCDAVGEVLLARILMYHRRLAHDGTLWLPPDGGTGPLADRCSCCAPTVARYAALDMSTGPRSLARRPFGSVQRGMARDARRSPRLLRAWVPILGGPGSQGLR
jgi:hypothetical protein